MKKEDFWKTIAIAVIVVLVALIVYSLISDDVLFGPGKGGGKPPKTSAQCNDHIDNDGDGYCDFAWRKAYCSDGSTAGDSDCTAKDDNDESGGCIPACSSNSDCGTSGYIGNLYCLGDGNSYRDYVTYTCDNTGTCSAVCNSQTNSQLWWNCQGMCGCISGSCQSCTNGTNSTG